MRQLTVKDEIWCMMLSIVQHSMNQKLKDDGMDFRIRIDVFPVTDEIVIDPSMAVDMSKIRGNLENDERMDKNGT